MPTVNGVELKPMS